MKSPSDRLIERANQSGTSDSIGLDANAISKIPVTHQVLDEIEDCLSSEDSAEIKWGMWFANGILGSDLPQEFLKGLISRLPCWLKHKDAIVRETALDIFVRVRDNYSNYREIMLEILSDDDPAIRWRALREYKTFLTSKDIPTLVGFQNDDYMTETEMGSPLIFALRNEALAAVENLCEKKFSKTEKVTLTENGPPVYWWDWQPFLNWWNSRRS